MLASKYFIFFFKYSFYYYFVVRKNIFANVAFYVCALGVILNRKKNHLCRYKWSLNISEMQ